MEYGIGFGFTFAGIEDFLSCLWKMHVQSLKAQKQHSLEIQNQFITLGEITPQILILN